MQCLSPHHSCSFIILQCPLEAFFKKNKTPIHSPCLRGEVLPLWQFLQRVLWTQDFSLNYYPLDLQPDLLHQGFRVDGWDTMCIQSHVPFLYTRLSYHSTSNLSKSIFHLFHFDWCCNSSMFICVTVFQDFFFLLSFHLKSWGKIGNIFCQIIFLWSEKKIFRLLFVVINYLIFKPCDMFEWVLF